MSRREFAFVVVWLVACGGATTTQQLNATSPAATATSTSTATATGTPTPVATPPPSRPFPPPKSTTIPLARASADPGDADLQAGDDAFERGDLATAQKRYEAARLAAPGSVVPSVGLARVRIARLDVPLDYGAAKGNSQLRAIAKELARALKGAPSFGPGVIELGRAQLLLGDASAALDSLRRGTQLLSDEPEAHSQLGVALLATGHASEAVSELARAAELDPGSSARHGNLGTALMMAGRTQDAIAEYEKRVGIDDGDPRAHSDLGTALLGTQDLARALSELQRAVQIDPMRPSFHSNLGYALQQEGRRDRAIAEYREALRLDPKLVSAWINLATALAFERGTRTEARAALEKARALSPDDPRVKANLEELDALERHAPAPP
jgi:Flp pilus assembly protein TadD